ncbi:MAG: YciI family protein [Bacteroidota bacterium]
MEKFMLIFHGGMPQDGTPAQMQENMGKWMAWVDKLAKADKYDSGEPLFPGGKLISGSNKTVTDGPFTEGKEVVGGYFIVKAADMAEVIEICNDYPDYDLGGSVQIRQVMKVEM